MLNTFEPPTAKFFADEVHFSDEAALELGVEIAPSPDGGKPIRHEKREAIIVRWDDLREVELVDPWPRMRLSWGFAGGETSELVGPENANDEKDFAAAVERAIEHVQARMPERVKRGWLDVSVIEWERVAAMPKDESTLDSVDWLRHSREGSIERVRASRTRTSYEALLAWLTSRPSLPWREQPRTIAITDHHVYALRKDGVFRLPLSALRLGYENESGDHVFVFGRMTRLVLPARLQCRVVDELLDHLENAETEATRSSEATEAT